MAITYNRNDKCGEATFCRDDGYTYTVDLYVGNCFLLMVSSRETEDVLHSFFVDDTHMERCLKNGIFTGYDIMTAISINKAKCRNYKKIVSLLTEYMDNIDISIYRDGEQTWKEWKAPAELIPDIRMRELAEAAISYLNDNDMIEDFMEDRYVEFDENECDYFCITLDI